MSDVETINPDSGMDDVFASMKAKLSGPEKAPAPESRKPETTEPQSEESDYPEDEELPEGTAEEAEDDDPETESEPDPETDTLEELEVDGEKFKVPAKLKPYILRQQDYTRKTQELAEVRKTAESELALARQDRHQYSQGMNVLAQVLHRKLPPMPPASLREDDPVAYMQLKEAHLEASNEMQALMAEAQRVSGTYQQDQQRAMQQAMAQAQAKLPELIPQWKDQKRWQTEGKQVAEYLIQQGYAPEEISSASDARAVAISRKAMLYDRIVAKRNAATPVAPKTQRPGPSRAPAAQGEVERSRRALAKTGRMEDGFAAFKAKLFPS